MDILPNFGKELHPLARNRLAPPAEYLCNVRLIVGNTRVLTYRVFSNHASTPLGMTALGFS